MALISEPAGGRDFHERQSRGYQDPLRVLNASLQEPAVRRLPRRPLESTSEVSNGQTALTCEVSQTDCFIQELRQDLLGAPYLPRRQTAAGRTMLYPSRRSVRVRVPGGDAHDFGDLLVRSTRPDRASGEHGDAVVAAHCQSDRESDKVVRLHAEQAGYGGGTPGRLVALHDIGAEPANRRRERRSAHGSWALRAGLGLEEPVKIAPLGHHDGPRPQ